MGHKKDRERFAQTGMVFRNGELVSAPAVVDDRAKRVGMAYLQRSSTSNQVKFLADSLHSGRLSTHNLKKSLEDNAHREMTKGADKLTKNGKQITVDTLLEEYRNDTEFKTLANEVGLDEQWFIGLAEREINNRKGIR
jgi:hypothetical protein